MNKDKNQLSIDLRSFLMITVLFSAFVGGGLYVMYRTDVSSLEHARNINEIMHNEVDSRTVSINLKDLFIELQIFSSHLELFSFLKSKTLSKRHEVELEALTLCKISKAFDQVRLLDTSGMELLRVNYNNGNPAVVPLDKLQNKSDRYYFQEAMKLSAGEIYVSPFDLNIENGQIEQPLKPMIRVCASVFSDSGTRLGVVILNYLGQRILTDLQKRESNFKHTMLLNADGYWLLSPDKNLEWTFMYPDKKSISFASTYPEAWAQIKANSKGQFSTPAGEFTFSTIVVSPGQDLDAEANLREWKLVCLLPSDEIDAAILPLVRNYSGLFAGAFLIILFGAYTRARYVRSNAITKGKLEQARMAAENANEAKSDFLAKMSHEIRTPLNAVIGLTHLAQKTTLTPKQADYLKKISHAGQTLLGIINDILDLSKIEADRVEIDAIDFNLDDVLNNLSNMLALKAEQKGVELLLLVQSPVPSLLVGDPLRLGQILLNLAGNALKFTESGEVIIWVNLVERLENKVNIHFSIQDTGIGISKEQLDRLFQPFSQADGSITRKYGGTGLGLVISKRLIELMGGTLHVESKPGKGSTFSFTIPLTLQAKSSGESFVYPDNFAGMRVLVVDANKASRLILCKTLDSFSFDVTIAQDGNEALELLQNNDASTPFKLVITALKLTDMSGLELAKMIKKTGLLQQQPKIILLTSHSHDGVRHQAEQLGLDAFMLRPFNRSILFDTIMDIFGDKGYVLASLQASQTYTIPANVSGARVLLAEDNEINQQVAREILEDAGVHVSIAGNGKTALEMLERGTYDAVLMDLQMPVMDGYTAIKAIRSHQHFMQLPVIAMTAHALSGDKEKSLLAGMNDYIVKPIDPELLITVLSNWLPQKPMPEPSPPPQAVSREPKSTAFPPIPGIDTQMGLARLRGNAGTYKKLLLHFAQERDATVEKITPHTAANSLQNIMVAIHTAKSVAGNLGAQKLFSLLKEMEEAITQEKMPSDALFQAFETEFRTVAENILQAFPANQEIPQPEHDIDPIRIQQLRPELERLALLLKEHDIEARNVFSSLKLDLEKIAPDCTAKIADFMDQFDFTSAGNLIEVFFEQCHKTE